MRIDVAATWQEARFLDLRCSTAVAIDVLRATSTIVTAIQAGARRVIPTETPEQARSAAARVGKGDCVLGGERGGLRIEGFDLGNSPREYTPFTVGGKTLVLSTTNGTQALAAALQAETVCVAALLNVGSVADRLIASRRDIAIICAGTEGRVSLDDLYCAGMLVSRIVSPGNARDISDGARLAMDWYVSHAGASLDVLASCIHGRRLAELGFQRDLEYCSGVDVITEVPIWEKDCLVRS